MKELSIEEKAKRYDEAIERAKKYYSTTDSASDIKLIGLIFPELKESEDERMIQYFKDLAPFDKADELYEKYGFSHKDAIAWLEKQGEHANFRNKIQIGDKVTRNEDGVLVNLSQLKRIAKPTEEYNITGISSKNAQGKLGEMIKNLKSLNEVLEHESAWSEKHIADVFEKVGLAKIAREQSNDNLTNALQDAMIELSKFIPQPKQEWSEEDEYCRHQLIVFCENCMVKDDGAKRCAHWLKSLKPQNGYNPYKEIVESIAEMCKHYDKASHSGLRDFYDNVKVKCKDAKEYDSLYPQSQWKPSEKQKEALLWCVVHLGGADKQTLGELLEELNKL